MAGLIIVGLGLYFGIYCLSKPREAMRDIKDLASGALWIVMGVVIWSFMCRGLNRDKMLGFLLTLAGLPVAGVISIVIVEFLKKTFGENLTVSVFIILVIIWMLTV